MPFDLSMGEILVVLFVALLVFGGKLPETARKFGSALSEFKRGMREELRKVENGVRNDEPPKKQAPAPPDREEPTAEEGARNDDPKKQGEPAQPDSAEPTRRGP